MLPHWLRDGAHDCLRIEYAIGVGRPEAAVPRGHDVPANVAALVAEAVPELRAACRRFLLSHALAPHARWEAETADDVEAPVVTVADLERQLRELADAGDRSAIVTLLAALDPARYGPPGRMTTAAVDAVDTVDFTPVIK